MLIRRHDRDNWQAHLSINLLFFNSAIIIVCIVLNTIILNINSKFWQIEIGIPDALFSLVVID